MCKEICEHAHISYVYKYVTRLNAVFQCKLQTLATTLVDIENNNISLPFNTNNLGWVQSIPDPRLPENGWNMVTRFNSLRNPNCKKKVFTVKSYVCPFSFDQKKINFNSLIYYKLYFYHFWFKVVTHICIHFHLFII